MKKNKKSLKGMTLIEVLVSLAVFAMLSAILLGYGAYVDKTSRATRVMKNKVVEEAHYASSRSKQYVDSSNTYQDLDHVAGEIVITMNGYSGEYLPFKDPADHSKGYADTPVSYSDPTATLDIEVYDTSKAYEEYLRSKGYTDAEIAASKDEANGKIDINFIDDTSLSVRH